MFLGLINHSEGTLPLEKFEATQNNWIRQLKETNLGVARASFDH